ncbi:hypothetical protein Tco_1080675 [Tanacetum coccineum]|uniref:Retrovirus-related Pol polyprotein from transposon TNT 1-94-like beta-barrel domain-containing protein n=1 Tax=Tanacetum coccineum TaxID=301880 RepID=A0ABQ5HWX5_9ASTR
MAGEDDQNINNQPPNPPPPTQQAPHTVSTIKLPILKKGEYDIWAMKMEHYLAHTDYPIWEVIQNGNGPVSISTDTQGQIKILPPKSAEEILARERERKARTTLLMALPEDHLARFHNISDAKEMWDAIKTRFSGIVENTGNKDKENGRRTDKQEDSKALVTIDGKGVNWTSHSKEEKDYALMACNSSGSDTEVKSCSNKCVASYNKLKKLYDEQRAQLSDASIEIQAYTQALKKVEAQLVAHQQGQLWYEQKIKFMKIDLDDKTDVLTYHKKLLAEAQKEKEDLKAKVEKWHNSSKNLSLLQNSQMSANDKFGLGYGDHRYDGILSYENEVLQSVFMNKESDLENQPLYDRFVTAEGMHVVPPPMTGNYMPSGPDIEIDYSQFTYGPKQSQPSESETQTSEFDTCESNISVETPELVSEPVVNEPNVVCQPKVWSDAPIIEEYESDSDDYCVSKPTKEQEQPSFASTNKQVKTPRETVKNQFTHSKNPKVDKKGLGYGFTTKACFVCGSLSHLIRDCDFHEKRMAKQAKLKNRMRMNSSQREIWKFWNNVQRVNHKNKFVPTTVLTRTSKIPVNTARASGTNNVSTGRHNLNRQAVPSNGARKVNTVKPIVNNDKANIVKPMLVLLGENEKLLLSPQQVVLGDQKGITGKKSPNIMVDQDLEIDYPHRALKNKGIVDSGCSRHMTGNKAYLAEYQDFNGGPVAFGGSKGNLKTTRASLVGSTFASTHFDK